jgi:cysteinyl-tRNA synthetase
MAVKNLYTCGPTVYDNAHIGNLRAYIIADVYYRSLIARGEAVKWVMNITDVDDKTIAGALRQSGTAAGIEELRKYTAHFSELFFLDLESIGVKLSDINFILVTDVIPQIQSFIIELIDKGYAYQAADGSTYFSIEKYQQDFGDYGALVGDRFLEGKKLGARVSSDEYSKDELSDFVLWKAHQPTEGNIYWDHPKLGLGRPGWHIECSVINRVAFGETPTDIHTGGVDLIFPHHTNEIAQSQPIYKPFVRQWHHSEHLLVDGRKMSKSIGNVYRLNELKDKGHDPLAYRYLLLTAHYKSTVNFTWEALGGAQAAYDKLAAFIQESEGAGPVDTRYQTEFYNLIADDLNTPRALALVWQLIKDDKLSSAVKKATLLEFDKVLGLGLSDLKPLEIPPEVRALVTTREEARQAQDWAKSDALRDQIRSLGYEVKDTEGGQKVIKA